MDEENNIEQTQLTKKQNEAFEFMKKGKSVFLTGPGGTGKSYLLKHFIKWFKENKEDNNNLIFVTSTTGLSAILIDGMTIHRYSGIGIGKLEVIKRFINYLIFEKDGFQQLY
jgi:ATP-dependent DNA helicase PIF1